MKTFRFFKITKQISRPLTFSQEIPVQCSLFVQHTELTSVQLRTSGREEFSTSIFLPFLFQREQRKITKHLSAHVVLRSNVPQAWRALFSTAEQGYGLSFWPETFRKVACLSTLGFGSSNQFFKVIWFPESSNMWFLRLEFLQVLSSQAPQKI